MADLGNPLEIPEIFFKTLGSGGSCRTATLDFFSIWLNLKSQCFCALS